MDGCRLTPSNAPQTPQIIVSLPTQTTPSYGQTVIGRQSPHAIDVEEFRGIPYGKVEGRWKHSVVRTQLPSDVFDATRYGPKCPQPSAPNTTNAFQSHLDFPAGVEESEFDCLNLIISRPTQESTITNHSLRDQPLLPVYVYIHGGAFAFGAASDPIWDPARLISRSRQIGKPILVVKINYRLNVFGFLASTELSKSDGCNFGFFDQVTALKWIMTNISAFGGNSSQITLGGQSAGGISAYIHTLRALYVETAVPIRSSIIQSPAAGLCGPFGMDRADSKWTALCQHLGLLDMSAKDRLARLRSASTSELLEAVADLDWGVFTLIEDEPLLQRQSCNPECNTNSLSISGSNTETLNTHLKNQPLSVLLGVTSHEASIFIDRVSQIDNFDTLMSVVQAIPNHEQILATYSLGPDMSVFELHDGLYRLLTDVFFTTPAQAAFKGVEKYRLQRQLRVSNYVFETGNPFAGPFHKRANHCVDLIYLFDCFHDALLEVDIAERDRAQPDSSALRTHMQLVTDIQIKFIDFINTDPSVKSPQSPMESSKTTIYDVHRESRVVDPITNTRLKEISTRIRSLEGLWEVAQALVAAIVMGR